MCYFYDYTAKICDSERQVIPHALFFVGKKRGRFRCMEIHTLEVGIIKYNILLGIPQTNHLLGHQCRRCLYPFRPREYFGYESFTNHLQYDGNKAKNSNFSIIKITFISLLHPPLPPRGSHRFQFSIRKNHLKLFVLSFLVLIFHLLFQQNQLNLLLCRIELCVCVGKTGV